MNNCDYLGEIITLKKRSELGLDHSKNWSYCNSPNKPLGDYVCPCIGCGLYCRDFTNKFQFNNTKTNKQLFYYIYPRSDTFGIKIWLWRLIELSIFKKQFDYIIFCISHDASTDLELCYLKIQELFEGNNYEIITIPNSSIESESKPWERMVEKLLENSNENSWILRGHAKGVTKFNKFDYFQDWASQILLLCCGYFNENISEFFDIVGPARVFNNFYFGGGIGYHYAGSYYWIKSSKLKQCYKNITREYYGVEGFPSRNFPMHRAGDIGPVPIAIVDHWHYFEWYRRLIKFYNTNKMIQSINWNEYLNKPLYIITPSNQPEKSRKIIESEISNYDNNYLKVLVEEDNDMNGFGWIGRNKALDKIRNIDCFVYFLDDDNQFNPMVLIQLIVACKYFSDFNSNYLFSTVTANNSINVEYRNNMIGFVDTASVIWNSQYAKNLNWENVYFWDGINVCRAIARNYPMNFVSWQFPTTHNSRKWI